jgi:hypothetical protein
MWKTGTLINGSLWFGIEKQFQSYIVFKKEKLNSSYLPSEGM